MHREVADCRAEQLASSAAPESPRSAPTPEEEQPGAPQGRLPWLHVFLPGPV